MRRERQLSGFERKPFYFTGRDLGFYLGDGELLKYRG